MTRLGKIAIYSLLLMTIGGLLYVGISFNGRINTVSGTGESLEKQISEIKNKNSDQSSTLASLQATQEEISGTLQGLQDSFKDFEAKTEVVTGDWKEQIESLQQKSKQLSEHVNDLDGD